MPAKKILVPRISAQSRDKKCTFQVKKGLICAGGPAFHISGGIFSFYIVVDRT